MCRSCIMHVADPPPPKKKAMSAHKLHESCTNRGARESLKLCSIHEQLKSLDEAVQLMDGTQLGALGGPTPPAWGCVSNCRRPHPRLALSTNILICRPQASTYARGWQLLKMSRNGYYGYFARQGSSTQHAHTGAAPQSGIHNNCIPSLISTTAWGAVLAIPSEAELAIYPRHTASSIPV